MNTDIDRITKELDLHELEPLLENLTYASVNEDEMSRMGDAYFIKLFKLSQMSIEYLMYSQNYLETLTKTLDQ